MNIDVQARNFGLMGRLTQIAETAGPVWIMVGLLAVFALVTLALFGRRRELMFLLIMAATFSGAMWTAVDSGSTLLRWTILILLAFNCLRLNVYFGTPMLLFIMYAIIGIGLIPLSDVLVWSMQTGGLMLLTMAAAISLSDVMRTPADLRRILYLYLVAASGWFVLGMFTLRQLIAANSDVGRQSGAITSAPLFVITGGLLLVIAVWGTLCSKRWWAKAICGALALSLVAVLLASGQRTGTFAGMLGCLPMLIRKRASNLIFVVAAAAVVVALAFGLATANKKQVDFLKKRYFSTSTTGRTEIWANAFRECMKNPLIGRGHGSEREFAIKYQRPTHNSLLAVWYATGIFGVIFYLAAFGVAAWQAFAVMRKSRDPDMRDLGRVLLGLLIAEFAAGMFETANSPSNFATITLTIIFVMVGRLWIMHREQAQAVPAVRYMWVPLAPSASGGGLRPMPGGA